MFRFTFLIIQFLFLLTIVSLIFSNPFTISFDISNLKYSFSSNLFLGILIALFFLLYLILYLFFRSKFYISNYLLKNKYQKIEKGYYHFVQAMIAVANKDNKSAISSHRKMKAYLKNDRSLSLLLKSEVLKIEKKFDDLKDVYEDMVKSKKTQTLGYRGLMEINLSNQDYHHAFLYGEKLFSINPQIEKLYETLVYIVAKTKNWNQLIYLSDRAYANKIINRQVLDQNKSIGFYEIAKIKMDNDIEQACKDIVKAIDLRKNFPPYVKLHLEILSQMNNLKILKKNIKNYWYSSPNTILRNVIKNIIIKNKIDTLEFIKQIIKHNSEYEESKKLLIFFAIRNQDWKTARANINGLIGTNPSKEICLYMADIELGENSDKQKSDAWILRSQNARDEYKWTCQVTKQTQDEWQPLSDSGNFNSLVWYDSKMLNS